MRRKPDAGLPVRFAQAYYRVWAKHEKKVREFRPSYLTLSAYLLDAAGTPFTGIRWSKKDLLDCLTMIRGLHNLLDRKEGELLQRARDRGISFQEMADALGVTSRQAAEQRLLKLRAGRDAQEEVWLEARRRQRLGMDWSPAEIDRWWAATVMVGVL